MRAPEDAYPLATLRAWRLRRFKSVAKADVKFSPLTVVIGANSSGKSTLIQSILLAVQAAQAGESADVFPLNGPLVSLGTFEDVRCRTCNRRGAIELGGTLGLSRSFRPGVADWRGDTALSKHGRTWRKAISPKSQRSWKPRLGQVSWGVAFREESNKDTGAAEIGSARADWTYEPNEGQRETMSFRSSPRPRQLTVDAETGLQPLLTGTVKGPDGQSEQVFDPRLRGGVPVDFLVEEDENVLLAYEWVGRFLGIVEGFSYRSRRTRSLIESADSSWRAERASDATYQHGLDEGARCASEAYRRAKASGEDDWQMEFLRSAQRLARAPWRESLFHGGFNPEDLVRRVIKGIGPGEVTLVEGGDLAEQLAIACRPAATFLAKGVSYLGPLREDPHPIYQRAPAYGTSALGPKGEYTAAVILARAGDSVVCPRADGSSAGDITLKEALEYWLQYFGVAQRIEASPSPLGPVLRVAESVKSKAQDLINVGVGVSQLLPVVATCLLAEPGSLILLEQPELHLHPALQLKLGDFLLATALSGRQLVVETHSEHILARLRTHVVAAPSDELVRFVSILFAELREGCTEYREVRPNAYGGLDSWPEGFFDQSAKETQSILRRAVEKRRGEAQGEA